MGRRLPLLPLRTHRLDHRGAQLRPPPPGEVLAWDRGWHREARTAWGYGAALAAVLLTADQARGGLDWMRGCCWVAIGAALVAVLRPDRVTAGDGWLAVRGLLRERRVRTDLLTQLRRADGVAPRLVLRDAGGGRVELDPRVLVANPLLWHQLDAGTRRSRERGLLREGAVPLAALARRIDDEGARALLEG
ncbi:hypothetical protein FHS39_001578 [Streptomyces olivoverticillatus]|uniref:Uncharacterized protein n=1 Tax=Streptomyces olivoverticillatus TaxID=66427 RepID=A0A7W7LMK4_9ACTN|nr:hypothetical protein [Streptomyces olivoverticillatus]MBB4892567.1 hypothetical protein [Streptomyces olivoverticillatus]